MSWIQDAVVLLESLQELSAVEPYSYIDAFDDFFSAEISCSNEGDSGGDGFNCEC